MQRIQTQGELLWNMQQAGIAFMGVTPDVQKEGARLRVAQDGFALRWIQHYNPLQLEDQSVVDTFYGATTLDANRAVSVSLAA